MKFKPSDKAGGVVVELGPQEKQLPPTEATGKAAANGPAFELKKILVPVDFSDCSRKALRYALSFARQFGAELTLLHVVQPYLPVAEMALVETESTEDAHEALQELRGLVGDEVPCRTLVRTGSPPYEILGAAKELGIDLLILSTHGRSGLEHVLMGSTTDKVVRQAGCPVLVVREHEHEFIAPDETNLL